MKQENRSAHALNPAFSSSLIDIIIAQNVLSLQLNMDAANNGHVHKCTMCFFSTISNELLIRHIVRYHRHDPGFMLKCLYSGCGATYNKWKSFRQHLYRKHPKDSACATDMDLEQGETESFDTSLSGAEEYQHAGNIMNGICVIKSPITRK